MKWRDIKDSWVIKKGGNVRIFLEVWSLNDASMKMNTWNFIKYVVGCNCNGSM
jgi:hypothetical protein